MGNKQSLVMVKGETTKLARANDQSASLRSTVPRSVVSHLELQESDTILWTLKADPDNTDEFIVVVKKFNEKLKKKS